MDFGALLGILLLVIGAERATHFFFRVIDMIDHPKRKNSGKTKRSRRSLDYAPFFTSDRK